MDMTKHPGVERQEKMLTAYTGQMGGAGVLCKRRMITHSDRRRASVTLGRGQGECAQRDIDSDGVVGGIGKKRGLG